MGAHLDRGRGRNSGAGKWVWPSQSFLLFARGSWARSPARGISACWLVERAGSVQRAASARTRRARAVARRPKQHHETPSCLECGRCNSHKDAMPLVHASSATCWFVQRAASARTRRARCATGTAGTLKQEADLNQHLPWPPVQASTLSGLVMAQAAREWLQLRLEELSKTPAALVRAGSFCVPAR